MNIHTNKLFLPLIAFIAILTFTQCSSSKVFGEKVKEPFSGSKYESNSRFFRAKGKGMSMDETIARGKADIESKQYLAGQVNTTMKQVTDQYLTQTENANAANIGEKFESLVRQTMNTNIADLRKIGEEKYYDGEKYTVFIAYEIKKRAMFNFMKKQARVDKKISKKEQKVIEDILQKEIEKIEE